jgi:hypothetical protein
MELVLIVGDQRLLSPSPGLQKARQVAARPQPRDLQLDLDHVTAREAAIDRWLGASPTNHSRELL